MAIVETDVELMSDGDVCRAWFFVPTGASDPLPCIVMAHGFGLTRRCHLRDFAVPFAEAGYAVLVFDYRGFGDSDGEPRQLISFRKQLQDWRAAITFARERPDVDATRIVTWGFSLGAGHALTVAARDDAVKAAVAVAPMFDGLSSTLAAMKRWSPMTFLRIAARGIRDLFRAALRLSPVTVPFTAPPGEVGLLTSPDAYPGYRAMVPDDFNYDTPARIALSFWTYFPGLRLRTFSRPILVLPCSIDAINPPAPTIRRANQCKSATLLELECEHMGVTVEPHRTRVLEASLEFLHSIVPSGKVE